ATSGLYFAQAKRDDTGGASDIFFVVRDDAGTSDLLFQTADTTWQAYNTWGGSSLYQFGSFASGGGVAVSYNRPLTLDQVSGGYGDDNSPWHAEYPMIRWLEQNGYDVSYSTDVDSARNGGLILNHRAFLSVGHDEYWSGPQRANVEAARDAGVNLAFFSGNESYWKTRWQPSIDASATAYRTLVTYKESINGVIDPLSSPPSNVWTGTWRDPAGAAPLDGRRPENAMSGTAYMADRTSNDVGVSLTVPYADAQLQFWRNTSVASLQPGQVATLGQSIVGYETDEDLDNGFRPAGLIDMSSTTFNTPSKVLSASGTTVGPGTSTHSITLYRASSGALVFGAGTVQWSWGLDGHHNTSTTTPSAAIQQATVNLFADMQVQPGTIQSGLVYTAGPTNTSRPSSVIASPASGAVISPGAKVTITGTATAAGGGHLAGVEVSTDGGRSWHPATGRASWSYAWIPSASGSVTLKSRAVDDNLNLEVPSAGVTVTVGSGSGGGGGGGSLWNNTITPAVASASDTSAVELGVKFTADTAGSVTGVRFYKGSSNTGTHVGHLWSATGALLASATFTGESATGWQQVSFANPVAISANTTYVVSYLAPAGGYAYTSSSFATAGYDNSPLHVGSNAAAGGNGVYVYGGTGGFPTNSFNATNYWVDLTFKASTSADTTPPTVVSHSPASNATGVSVSSPVTATFSEPVQSTTVVFTLSGPGGVVASTRSYDAASGTVTLTPGAPLTTQTTYTASLSGAKDTAGNTMAPVSWSFITGSSVVNLWQQTTAADFSAGVLNNVAVTNTSGGEVQLASGLRDDFNGTVLSTSWTSKAWGPGAAAAVSSGILTVTAEEILSKAAVPEGTGVEASVRFTNAYQHFGLATDLAAVAGNSWGIFSTAGTTGTLFARVNSNGTVTDVNLGALPSGFHTYLIQQVATGFAFSVDGVLKTTIAATIPSGTPLKSVLSDFNGSAQSPLQADWLRMIGGSLVSSVFNAGVAASWQTANWTATVPSGTGLTVQTSSSTDGVTWSNWANLSNGGKVASPVGRYFRYRVAMTTTNAALTPVLSAISFSWQ
ncbi:MAG: hypothetical protein JWN86_2704, partial [Planctomycetota bacterium]|nr:hypothetical protein [Planctomycetota bacterium]